uniref:Uncharacterized protein n=1 Tax=Anopheles dirus TaxID=7168 RepID=A0A182NYG8_9DIPT
KNEPVRQNDSYCSSFVFICQTKITGSFCDLQPNFPRNSSSIEFNRNITTKIGVKMSDYEKLQQALTQLIQCMKEGVVEANNHDEPTPTDPPSNVPAKRCTNEVFPKATEKLYESLSILHEFEMHLQDKTASLHAISSELMINALLLHEQGDHLFELGKLFQRISGKWYDPCKSVAKEIEMHATTSYFVVHLLQNRDTCSRQASLNLYVKWKLFNEMIWKCSIAARHLTSSRKSGLFLAPIRHSIMSPSSRPVFNTVAQCFSIASAHTDMMIGFNSTWAASSSDITLASPPSVSEQATSTTGLQALRSTGSTRQSSPTSVTFTSVSSARRQRSVTRRSFFFFNRACSIRQ